MAAPDGAKTKLMDAKKMLTAIEKAGFATANDELRPVMNGVRFEFFTDGMVAVASDGHKLAKYKDLTITYDNSEDLESYKKGGARSSSADVANEAPNGFYFESNCITYGDEGKFDEDATLAKCPIATEKVEGSDKSEGYVNDEHVFSFSVAMNFSPEIFSQSSHNVLFYSPSRRNVSDSYRAIEDFFTTSLEDSKNGGSK
jgi:hypothetical protein